MSAPTELRRDPLTGRLAIVAAGRAARPHTVEREAPEHAGSREQCPFCEGNEQMTPPEVYRTGEGSPGTDGWRVRVVPNLYPIVGAPGSGPGATGAHEVVVLSPAHHRSFGALTDAEAIEVTRVLRDRASTHLAGGGAYAVALVNHRRAAGASIAHPHAQVVALDFVPPRVQRAARRAAATTEDLLAADLAVARQHDTVLVGGDACAWFPHAAGTPYSMRVAHDGAGPRFDSSPDAVVDAVSLVLRSALERLGTALDDPPYNLTVHTAAADGSGPSRWYAEITPRLSVEAGFEMATGVRVNTTPAEQAVRIVRDGGA
jgi:UDPglucose--hexose-1-phosphate uridylyltransferase